MRLLDRYILRYFITTYLFTLGLFVGIAVVFDLTERLDALVGKRVPMSEILFDYYFNLIPYLANLFSPLFVFVAVIFFTARLAARSEVVAMLGSGIPFGRLMYPYLIGAMLIAGSNWYLAGYVLPHRIKSELNSTTDTSAIDITSTDIISIFSLSPDNWLMWKVTLRPTPPDSGLL